MFALAQMQRAQVLAPSRTEKTLAEAEVNAAHEKVLAQFKSGLSATLREG